MLDRPIPVNDESQTSLRVNLQQYCAEKQRLDEGESRVSTDSDLDLESEDEDDYRSTFSDLLMRRLVAVELAQQQQVLREEKLMRTTPLQLFAAADDSYWAKMRRVHQWRESTIQSESPSETASDYSPPPTTSRKRRLSEASLPSDTKRPRLTALSPAPPGSPFFPNPRVFSLDKNEHKSEGLGAYAQSYYLRAELRDVHSYPGSLKGIHVCTACDSSFISRQRLRRHGRGAWTPDACRAAVTYGLEVAGGGGLCRT
ncbi:hypothetical protein K439DRAFT_1658851 [Ramaria rubella]|nr:hypothetical protein K439DRAFT_1658851 [Ramaria rubella]